MTPRVRYFEMHPKGWTRRTDIAEAIIAAVPDTWRCVSAELRPPQLLVDNGRVSATLGVRIDSIAAAAITSDGEADGISSEEPPTYLGFLVEDDLYPRVVRVEEAGRTSKDLAALKAVLRFFVKKKYQGDICFYRDAPDGNVEKSTARCILHLDSWVAEVPELRMVDEEMQPPYVALAAYPEFDGLDEDLDPILEECIEQGLREIGLTLDKGAVAS